jgi:ubiquinone/menaquinone biosynthesis C-methylase UbiE
MTSSSSAFGGSCSEQIDPFDPNDRNLWRKAEYLGRYLFAADFLSQHKPKIVADISCGMGYGSVELSGIAGAVIAVDNSQELLEKASMTCKSPNARFLKKNLDGEDLVPEIAECSVDAVVSFETLEHLVDPSSAMSSFHRILRLGGFFLCSVPNLLSESGDCAGLPRNKSHKQWFSFQSLQGLVQSHGMQVIYRLGQSRSRALFRREQQLCHARRIPEKLSEEPMMHESRMIRWLSYVVAYPTVEDVDGSYSIIIVAKKDRR